MTVFFLSISFNCTVLADDTLDDFPTPLGADWAQLTYAHSQARAIVEIPEGYVVAGRQNASVGSGLDYFTVLVRLSDVGNVAASKTFHEVSEYKHNEARDIIARYNGEGALTGYAITGAQHQDYHFEGQDYDLPDIWLMTVGTDLEKDWEATFGNPFSDWGNSLVWDGAGRYIIGGEFTNPNSFGYLLSYESVAGEVDWEMYYNSSDGDIPVVVYDVCLVAGGGYALATEGGIRKMSSASPPIQEWASESDEFKSIIEVADGFVATGSADITGDPNHTDLVLTKVNASGAQVWRHTFGRATPALGASLMNDYGEAVIQTTDGGYAVVGTTASYAWHGGYDVWVIKTDADGNREWDVVLGDAGGDAGADIIQEDGGALVVAGTASWEGNTWFYIVKMTGNYQPPVPAFTYSPSSPFYIQIPVQFDGSASDDPDGDIVLYEWDFGDGASSTGVAPAHTYITPGTYTVSLYITDDDGVRREASQTVEALPLEDHWEHIYGDGRDYGYDLEATPDGGFLVSGLNCPSGDCDLWALKLDSQGNQLWARVYPDSYYRNDGARKGIVGHDGNYILAGFRQTNIDSSYRDMRILKVNAFTGDKIWEKFFDLGDFDDAFDIQPVGTDYYIISGVGATGSGPGFQNMRLLLLDEEGSQVWAESYSNDGDLALIGHAVTTTADGGFLAIGGTSYSTSSNDLVAIKTDHQGAEVWRTPIPATGRSNIGNWVHQLPDGSYVIAGSWKDDYALIRLKADGTLDDESSRTWGTDYDRDYIEGASVTPDNGFMLAGSQFIYCKEEGICDYYGDQVYLARTDSQGDLAWEKAFGALDADENGQDVVYMPDGSIVVLAAEYVAGGTWLFKMGGNQLPEGDFSMTPATPENGETVTFTAAVDDPDGTISNMVWRFGRGQGDPLSTTETSVTYTYPAAGTYTVILTVFDNHGGAKLITHDITVTGEVVDLCPDDPLKTEPGMCGCGHLDLDTDTDTVCDYEDNCPTIANTSQDNLDGDSLGDACDADADGDGYESVLSGGQDNNDADADMNPSVETGPAGDQPGYDGNDDGT
ncbi:MAG: hypothetical protein DRI98_12785, partial [Bacteroidetes bacterium]